MQDDPPDSTSDEFSVRLSWPKPDDPAADAPADAPAPADATAPAPAAAPRPAGGATPAGVPRPAASSAPASAVRPSPGATGGAVTTVRTGAAGARPTVPTDLGPGPESGVARAFVDAFDRLSDRLLDRLRVLRQDVDADLNGLRAEVAALRQSLEDNTYGLQLRQLQSSVDEVRTEVAGLRRAVLEWPELERVSDEVASMRGDMAFLFEAGDGAHVQPPSAVLAELEEVVGRLSTEVGRVGSDEGKGGDVAWLVDEVASIRTQLSDVARRLPVGVGDDPQLMARLADAVAERLLEALDAGTRRSKRR